MQEAESVDLPDDFKQAIRDGVIDIAEYDSETRELVNEYKDWYEKALACSDAIEELHESLAALYEENFNNVAKEYENKLSLIEHLTNEYNNGLELLEAKGYMASINYYKAMQNVTGQNIATMLAEVTDLENHFAAAMASGEIEEGSEAWYSMRIAINEVKDSIAAAKTEMAEFDKKIRETKWERFEYLQDRISQITQEANFLIDILENSKLFDDNGKITDEGMASVGLHSVNYNVYMAQADKYAQEIAELEKSIARDPYNTELILHREELLRLQQESIKAAEQEKGAIKDLVKTGIEKELESLKKLISTYTNALDSAKDLYEYQNKVKKQTDNIASLQKQLAAYKNDLSEETQAKVQKLTVELAKSEEELQQTEYEKMVSDNKKLLDELYDDYSEVLNNRLDNVDSLIGDMITAVNNNAKTINQTISGIAESVGYTLTPQMQSIWSGATTQIGGVVTKYGDGFDKQNTAVKITIDEIARDVNQFVIASEQEAQRTIESASTTPSSVGTQASAPTQNTAAQSSEKSSGGNATQRDNRENYGVALAIINGTHGWGDGDVRKRNLRAKGFDPDTIQSIINKLLDEGYVYSGAWEGRYYGIRDLDQYDIKRFKRGGLVDYTGLAQLDGTRSNPEMVLSARDTENFIQLKDALRSLIDQPLSMGQRVNASSTSLSGIIDVSDRLASIKAATGSSGMTFGDFNITIPIDHVEDYNDFMRQMQRDDRFEKMILDMTVNRLSGQSALDKYRHHW